MQTGEMIPVDEFCVYHNIETSFIYSLKESGLIEIEIIEEKIMIPYEQLSNLERIVRLYYEFGINLEGLETISYLLQRMNEMQQEIVRLNNRLRAYESK